MLQAQPVSVWDVTAKAKGKGSNEVVTAYVRARIAQWEREGKAGRDLATRVGVSGSAISQIKSGKLGVGWDVLGGFADAFGRTLPEFIQDAIDWDEGGRTFEKTERFERYPNRVQAARFARGQVSQAAIDAVLSMELQSDEDPPPGEWFDMIRVEERRLRMMGRAPSEAEREQRKREADTEASIERTKPKLPPKR